MPKPYLILLILCLFTGVAYATPSVTEVENTIASGNYVLAKKQLHEVLQRHPDSIVATKYLLEVLKIEYAETLVPSVEYKLYEQRLISLTRASIQRKADAEAAKQKALDDASKARFYRIVKWIFYVICAIAGVFLTALIIRTQAKRRAIANREKARKQAWLSEARASLIDIHNALNEIDGEAFNKLYSSSEWLIQKRLGLMATNLRMMELIRTDNYRESDVDSHLYEAYEFKESFVDPHIEKLIKGD